MKKLVWLLVITSFLHSQALETKDVQTIVGNIRGKQVITNDGLFTYFKFLGIPYAQPPIGKLRFKPPLPTRPWTQTLEALEHGPRCYQEVEQFSGAEIANMSENCLHLNIFTMDMKISSKPVMIWIHGGAFTTGSGNDYTPRRLIQEGIVGVTINYRLNSLGFLTFGNDLVSGNMGLKDQALAIQWVKQNIQNFGGNPNKITIFGESAGGISVHAQVLSPLNYGQIQGAIAQSGSMLAYNNIDTQGGKEAIFAKKLAKLLGCSVSHLDYNLDHRTLECLQNADIQKISGIEKKFKSSFEWRPIVDNYASNPFLPFDPLESMKTGTFNKIPFMSGTVKNEGALMLGMLRSEGKTKKQIIENWEEAGPRIILSSPSMEEANIEGVLLANISMKYYNHPEGDTQTLLDLFSDVTFISPDQKTVQLMSKYSKHVFNYHFTQPTPSSFTRDILKLGPEYTPVHGDDLVYLLEVDGVNGIRNWGCGEENALSRKMVNYWTNFAKFGHPTPSSHGIPLWHSVTQTESNYMVLKDSPEMGQDLLLERMAFWERMMWTAKEEKIDRKLMMTKATRFLHNNTNKAYLLQ